jgi:hypothetical protein
MADLAPSNQRKRVSPPPPPIPSNLLTPPSQARSPSSSPSPPPAKKAFKYGRPIPKLRRGATSHHIAGFASELSPLPPNLNHEEIIKRYPNHLRGQLLFVIAEHWSAREIADTCPAKEINAMMMGKRIEYARKTLDPNYIGCHERARMRKRGEQAAAASRVKGRKITARDEASDSQPSSISTGVSESLFLDQDEASTSQSSLDPELGFQQPPGFLPSSPHLTFLTRQEGLLHEVLAEDPAFDLQRTSSRWNRLVDHERELVRRAEMRMLQGGRRGEVGDESGGTI